MSIRQSGDEEDNVLANVMGALADVDDDEDNESSISDNNGGRIELGDDKYDKK